MTKPYLVNILESNYCKLVFLASFIGSYFLIPENVFHSDNRLIAMIYMLVFALTVTCIIRNVKERVLLTKTYKTSIFGILASAIGLSALQVCGMSGMCVAAATGGLASLLLPEIFRPFIEHNGIALLYGSILLQLIALYSMGCFNLNKSADKNKTTKDDKKMIDNDYTYAVVGVSENEEKYGYKVFKDFKNAGYKVLGINPKGGKILDQSFFKSLADVSEKIDVVIFIVKPEVVENVLVRVNNLGIKKVWMQPGSESEKAVNFCKKNKIAYIEKACIMLKK